MIHYLFLLFALLSQDDPLPPGGACIDPQGSPWCSP